MAERKIIHPAWGAGRLECDGTHHFFVHPKEQVAQGHPKETNVGICRDPEGCARLTADAEKTPQKQPSPPLT
jgi:hypothetical protein